jgi:hypothetical protein
MQYKLEYAVFLQHSVIKFLLNPNIIQKLINLIATLFKYAYKLKDF